MYLLRGTQKILYYLTTIDLEELFSSYDTEPVPFNKLLVFHHTKELICVIQYT